MNRKGLHALMMIISTSVGVGILGLPVVMSSYSFCTTLISFGLAWIFMTLAALYVLDVKMRLKAHYSLAGMIRLTLGPWGHRLSSCVILLLLYALLSTYLMAIVAWLKLCIPALSHRHDSVLILGFILLFMGMMFFKEQRIYKVNHILGLMVIVIFFSMILIQLKPTLDPFVILSRPGLTSFPAMSFLLTTFGFSIVVPGVTEYLDYDVIQAKRAIFWGSILSLGAYILWEWIVLAHVPLQALQALQQAGDNGTGVLLALSGKGVTSLWMMRLGWLFGVLMVMTSFIGISLSLLHFLSDVLNIPVIGQKRLPFIFLMYAPAVMVALFYPKAFIDILSIAGLFVALLLGLFPALMILRFKKQFWGRIAAYSVALFFVLVMIQELIHLLGIRGGTI